MSLIKSEYRAPGWLPGGNLQTIVPAELFPKAKVIYRRDFLEGHDRSGFWLNWRKLKNKNRILLEKNQIKKS